MKRYKNTPYFVTECGKVFREGSSTPLKPDASTPYLRVTFCIDGKISRHSIHRLVAETYIPNPQNKPEVNHKDLDKLNNHYSNLEWVSGQENTIHAYRLLKGSSWGNIKASKAASHMKYRNTYNKYSQLLGKYFVDIVHLKPRHRVKWACPNCLTHLVTDTSSTRFKEPLSLLCKPCKKLTK